MIKKLASDYFTIIRGNHPYSVKKTSNKVDIVHCNKHDCFIDVKYINQQWQKGQC